MTQFEFVQVTVAIILGLGLTDILRGLGEQYRYRHEIEISRLQVGASFLLLFIILIYLWSFWLASDVIWNLPRFLIQVVSAIALALSAQFIKIDLSSGKTPEAQYFDNSTATFLSWAVAPLFAFFFAIAVGDMSSVELGRLVAVALLVSLGIVSNPTYHAVMLTVLFLLSVFAGPVVILFELQ